MLLSNRRVGILVGTLFFLVVKGQDGGALLAAAVLCTAERERERERESE